MPQPPPQESTEPTAPENEGVRLAFSLRAAGDILEEKAFTWLKQELRQCLGDIKATHINSDKISYTIGTAYIDLPKKSGPAREPRLYTQAIRDSLALAYQMSVRWALSEYSNPHRSLITAITAGPLEQAGESIQALLSAAKSGVTNIRMTDFARLCTRLADVKIIFSRQPEEVTVGLTRENPVKVWHVNYFWAYLYFDFITPLLADDMLPTSRNAYEKFRNALFSPDRFSSESKALAAIRKFPQNSLLIIEIARILMARRMFHEADDVLDIILTAYPLHIVARTCRLVIYEYLCLQQTDVVMAERFFERAVAEFAMIKKHHADEAEIYIEAGLLHYSRAVQLINQLTDESDTNAQTAEAKKIKEILDIAQNLFQTGTAMQPTADMRAEFCKRMAKTLQVLLEKDRKTLVNGQPITDELDIIYDISLAQWQELGWIQNNTPEEQEAFFERLSNLMAEFSGQVAITNWSPSVKCVAAAQFWNILPSVNVFLVKMMIATFEEAIREAEDLSRYGIGIYASSGAYTYIQTPAHFIANVSKYIQLLTEVVKEDLDKPDDHVIAREKIRQLALPLVLLNDPIETDVILKE